MPNSFQSSDLLNLIGGERAPSIAAGRFESKAARAPFSKLPTCPRSDARDLELLYEEQRPTRRPTQRLSADRSIDLLEDVAYALEDRLVEGGGSVLAQTARIGHPFTNVGSLDKQLDRLDAQADSCRARGVTVCLLPWCDSPGELFERVGRALLSSQLVILASDERAPFLADMAAELLLDCGWPAERFALLHALSDDALALAANRGARLSGRVDRSRLKRVRGLLGGNEKVQLDVARTRTLLINQRIVERESSLTGFAQRLVGQALGQWGGQAHDSLGSLHVEPDVFAPFEEAFVDAFEQYGLVREPGPLIDREAHEAMGVRVGQGLDEGATLISTKPTVEPSSRRRPPVSPALFTNAEPRSRLVLEDRPLPVVTLVRASRAPRS